MLLKEKIKSSREKTVAYYFADYWQEDANVPKVAAEILGIILTGSKLLHSNMFLNYVKYVVQALVSNCPQISF